MCQQIWHRYVTLLIHMKISLDFSTYSISYLRESVFSSLTPVQKRVLSLALIALACLAAGYLLFRCCAFTAKILNQDDHKPAPNRGVVKADHQPSSAQDYVEAAMTLHLDEKIEFPDGTQMSQEEVLLKAIELDPDHAMAYNLLGTICDAKSKISLPDGTEKNQRELFLKALELDDTLSSAYCNLGATLAGGGAMELPDGSLWTREEQFVRVLNKHKAIDRPTPTTVTLPKGTTVMTQRELYLTAIKLDPTNVVAYTNLCLTLHPTEEIVLPEGRRMNSQDLWEEVNALNDQHAAPYLSIAWTLRKNSPPFVFKNQAPMTKQELILKAIALNPHKANFYWHLAKILRYDEAVKLPNGEEMTPKDLLLKAIDLNPYAMYFYIELMSQIKTFPKEESIQLLNGKTFTLAQLINEAQNCLTRYGLDMSPY